MTIARNRLEKLLGVLETLALGEHGVRFELSPDFDDVDAIGYAINVFAEEVEVALAQRAEAIRDQERTARRLAYLLTASPTLVYTCRPVEPFPITYVSDNVGRLFGFEPDAVVGDPSFWLSRIHPEDVSRMWYEIRRLLETGESTCEYRFLMNDGAWRWILDKRVLVRDDDGHPLEILGSPLDITKRREAEEALRDAEEEKRLLLETMAEGIIGLDVDGKAAFVNSAAERLLGYGSGELRGRPIHELIRSSRSGVLDAVDVEGRDILQVCCRDVGVDRTTGIFGRRDGTRILVDYTCAPLRKGDRHLGAVLSFRDITERARTEQLATRFGRLLKISPLEIFVFDAQTLRFIEVNAGGQQNLGYSSEELSGMTPLDIKRMTRDRFEEIALPLRSNASEVVTFQARHHRRDGTSYPCEVHLSLASQDVGSAFVAIVVDIEQRLKSEAHLRKLSRAVEASPATVVITDTAGTIEYVNPKFCDITGYTREEAIGQNPRVLKSGAHSDAFYREMWRTITAGKVWQGELLNKKKNGELYWESASISAIRDDEGKITHFVAVKEDITLRKQVEETRKERARLQALETEIAVLATKIVDISEFERRCGELLAERAEAECVEFWSRETGTDAFERRFGAGTCPRPVDGPDPGESAVSRIASAGRPHVSRHPPGDQMVPDREWAEREGMAWFGGFPIVVGGRTAGVVSLYSRRRLSTEVERTLERIADDIAHKTESAGSRALVERSEEMFRSLYEATGDAVMLLDSEHFLDCNPATLKMFGFDRVEEFTALHPADISPPVQADGRPSLEAANERIAVAMEKGSNRFEWVHRRRDGNPFPAEVLLNRMRIDGKPVLEAVVRDMTDWVAAKEALRRATSAAEAASRAKSVFLANMSHEIQTPMNAVLGFAQLLSRSELSAEQRHHVDTIHRSGEHLLTLINDILEMSRIEAGRVAVASEKFDLRALLEDVRSMFEELTGRKGLELGLHVQACLPRFLQADAAKVRQVLINLLSNALKFTDAGGIDVFADSDAVAPGRHLVGIAVQDTGCGIEPADLDRVFEPFEQTTAGVRAGGTGLGMAISRRFARLMDGDLTVQSAPGKGSRFTFTFEAAAGSMTAIAVEVGRSTIPVGLRTGSKRPRVLIVDDVETNRELLARLLSGVGFETRTAESGEQAVEEHDSRRPDLILMDLRMPGIGGVEAIRRLRSAGSDVPILAVSASVVGDDWRKAADAGANGFLSKPFSDAAVFARIGEVLHIDYVYGDEARRESSPPRADATELAAAVAELPGELVEELRRATIAGRIDRIGALIARVADRAPEAAERFREMADRFDYEQLLAALDTRSAS